MWEKAMQARLDGADAYTSYATQTRSLSFEDTKEVIFALDKITDSDFWRTVLELEKQGH